MFQTRAHRFVPFLVRHRPRLNPAHPSSTAISVGLFVNAAVRASSGPRRAASSDAVAPPVTRHRGRKGDRAQGSPPTTSSRPLSRAARPWTNRGPGSPLRQPTFWAESNAVARRPPSRSRCACLRASLLYRLPDERRFGATRTRLRLFSESVVACEVEIMRVRRRLRPWIQIRTRSRANAPSRCGDPSGAAPVVARRHSAIVAEGRVVKRDDASAPLVLGESPVALPQ